jgi:hypothetical protein
MTKRRRTTANVAAVRLVQIATVSHRRVYTYIRADSPLFPSHDSGLLSRCRYERAPNFFGIYGACACHPAPNLAALDYHRRTRHRNRGRR